jgi:hypothetical protein
MITYQSESRVEINTKVPEGRYLNKENSMVLTKMP